jgi:hypothetical protein
MSETATPVQNTTISLGEVANRYLDILQKTYDMVCFNFASYRKLNEQEYDEFARQLLVMPKQQARLDFEKAKAASEVWLLRNTLADILAIVVPLMEDVRTICELCNYKSSKKNDLAFLQSITTDQRNEFILKPIPDKFAHLEKNYGITCEVKEHVIGLLNAARSVMMKDSKVTKEEVDKDGLLKVKIRTIQIVQAPNPEGQQKGVFSIQPQISDAEHTFKEGDRIEFTKPDHIGSIITMGVFVTSMLKGLQDYARKTGAAND